MTGQAIYAVGDVHGHLDKLRAAHDLIAADGGAGAQVVHLGDLLDRGPDSRGVVEYLMQGQAGGQPWLVIRGNHDRMLPGFLRDPLYVDSGFQSGRPWVLHPEAGAAETLESYGVTVGDDPRRVHEEARRKVPLAHVLWLQSLPLWHLTPRALFVHAGVRPGIGLHDQTEQDLLWIRQPFLGDPCDHGVLVVHGHTALKRPRHYGNRVNLDSGAGYGRALTVARLDDAGVWVLTGDGPQLLQPEDA